MEDGDRQASERRRLMMLRVRDGEVESRRWAAWAAGLYRRSVDDPQHYASHREKRGLFIESMGELEAYARTGTLP
jgi:hypothetical protein